jgi:molecular chaperone GrpE
MTEKKLSEQEKKEKIKARLFEIGARAVLVREGKILILKRASGNIRSADKYDLPGGGVERGEGMEDALNREIQEETGLKVEIGSLLSISDSEKDYVLDEENESNIKVFRKLIIYLAFYKSGELKLSDEHQSFEWLGIDEAIEKFDEKDPFYARKRKTMIRAKEYLEMQWSLDSWKRCQADFENYKKDQARHLEEFRKYAKMDVIEQILPVVDNFEASLAHVPEKSQENKWVEGIVYIKKQLEDVLTNNGIEEIEVKVGDKFNPEIHEAVGGDGKKQKVARVIQKGYKIDGRILRAAKVEVS